MKDENNEEKMKKKTNGQIMAQILKQDIYTERGKLRHLVNDKIMEQYIIDLEDNKIELFSEKMKKEIKKLKEGIITAVDKTAKSKDEDIKLLKKQSKINYEDVLDYKKSLQKLEKEKETEMLNLEKCHNQLSKVREKTNLVKKSEVYDDFAEVLNNLEDDLGLDIPQGKVGYKSYEDSYKAIKKFTLKVLRKKFNKYWKKLSKN